MSLAPHRYVAILGVLLVSAAVRANPAASSADLKIIVSADNKLTLEPGDLENYFLTKVRHWSDGTSIVALNAPRGTDLRQSFDQAILKLTPDESARYWLDQRIRSGVTSPREVTGDALSIKLVVHLKGTIAYVSASTNTDSVRVIARIHDDKVLMP
jgi:hypothetical protein